MKKNILIFAVIIFSIILEISFFPNFFSLHHSPSLVLVFIVFLAVWDESKNFWKWAFLAGMLLDVISFQPLGLHSFSFMALSLLANFISERFLASQKTWNFIIIAVLIFFSSLLSDWLVIIFIKLEYFIREKKYIEGLVIWDSGIFYRALYASILGAFFYNSIKRMLAALSKRPAIVR